MAMGASLQKTQLSHSRREMLIGKGGKAEEHEWDIPIHALQPSLPSLPTSPFCCMTFLFMLFSLPSPLYQHLPSVALVGLSGHSRE